MSAGNYSNIKYGKNKAIILKCKEKENKIIEEIKEGLTKKGYANKKIDYEEFLKIYMPYKEKISEINFAKALGILEGNFRKAKI